MLIANRTSNSANRWVALLPDGSAMAYAYVEASAKPDTAGIAKLSSRIVEHAIKFTDEKDLRLQANAWVKNGEVSMDANNNVIINSGGQPG